MDLVARTKVQGAEERELIKMPSSVTTAWKLYLGTLTQNMFKGCSPETPKWLVVHGKAIPNGTKLPLLEAEYRQ